MYHTTRRSVPASIQFEHPGGFGASRRRFLDKHFILIGWETGAWVGDFLPILIKVGKRPIPGSTGWIVCFCIKTWDGNGIGWPVAGIKHYWGPLRWISEKAMIARTIGWVGLVQLRITGHLVWVAKKAVGRHWPAFGIWSVLTIRGWICCASG